MYATIAATALVYSVQVASFLHIKDFALSIGLAGLSLTVSLKQCRPGIRAFLPFWILLGVMAVALFFRAQPVSPVEGLRELLRLACLLLFATLAWPVLATEKSREGVQRTVMATATLCAALGVIQYFGGLNWFFPNYGGTAQRMYGVFGNSALLGGYLAIALPLMIGRLLRDERLNVWMTIGMLVSGSAILMSGSRAAWLAAAVGCAVAVLGRNVRFRRLAVVLALGSLAVVAGALVAPDATIGQLTDALTGESDSMGLRRWFWAGAWEMAMAHPIIGVGPGNFAYWSPSYLGDVVWRVGPDAYPYNNIHTIYAHNDLVQFVTETGAVGLLALCVMVFRLGRCKGPEWSALAAYAVFCLFYFPSHSAPHALVGLLLVGSLFARTPLDEWQASADRRASRAMLAVRVMALVSPIVIVSILVAPSFLLRKADDLALRGKPAAEAYRMSALRYIPLPRSRSGLARCMKESGGFEAAETLYRAALRDIDTYDVHLGLARLAWRRGDVETALNHAQQAVRRWPACEEAWHLIVRASPEPETELDRAEPFLDDKAITRLRETAGAVD